MPKDRWQTKADTLIRLADDQRGKPEGDLACEKLLQIINKHSESFTYQPLIDFAEREFTLQNLKEMKQQGISTDGCWTGNTLDDAIGMMVADYKRRLWCKRIEKQVHKNEQQRKIDSMIFRDQDGRNIFGPLDTIFQIE